MIPAPDCALCPRLVTFRQQNKTGHPDFFNGPVPSFGADAPALLVVGLAPGLKGANRTGRPFTGDYAGDLLYATLIAFGWARGPYGGEADDGLALAAARITNAVRCVPPENKPTPAEIKTCNPFLAAELAATAPGAAILALGRIAHDAVLAALELRKSAFGFGHGHRHALPDGRRLYDSYHCSRYNTNTGRLTPAMFQAVFQAIADDTDQR